MTPLLGLLVSQALNLILRAVAKGKWTVPDATPMVQAIVNALGHAAGETDEERATRRAETEAIFAKHSTPLVEPEVKP